MSTDNKLRLLSGKKAFIYKKYKYENKMSNSRFTKIYDKERELLFKTNSVTAYEVYFHLKGDNSYFKKEFMDLRRCIAAYLTIPERIVKDAL